ncbi:sulfatase, partial [Flavivirga rizhaonensis]
MKQYLVLILLVILIGNTSLKTDNPPNIVFVLIDDMGWKDMSCSGSEYYETPNIDALAQSGVRFTNAYSSSPVCSPSRGAILTGKNPARTKFTTVFSGESALDDRLYDESKLKDGGADNQNYEALHRHVLPSTEVLFSEVLQNAGYATSYFGKWHCGTHKAYTPNKRGFQKAIGYRKKHVPTSVSGHWGKTFKPFGVGLDHIKDSEYIADVLTEECIKFIRKNKEKPFITVLSHYLVHNPIQAKPELVKRFKDKITTDQDNPEYAAMLYSIDQSVGRLVNALKELGIEDNTMIIFTSDNGGLNRNTSNYPLLGGKSYAFEAGMRVPLIIKWPKTVKAGQVTKEYAIGMDFYPTFLDAAGITLQPEQHKDGISLLPILKGSKGIKRPFVFHFPHYTSNTSPFSSIIDGSYKLIRFYNDKEGGYMLFDLNKDPYEQNDLSSEMPEKVNVLKELLDKELNEMNAQTPYTNP